MSNQSDFESQELSGDELSQVAGGSGCSGSTSSQPTQQTPLPRASAQGISRAAGGSAVARGTAPNPGRRGGRG